MNIPIFKVNMAPEASTAVSEVLESNMIGEGPRVEEFTTALSKLFGNERVVATSSCTSALTMALRLAGMGFGDKVLCSPFTMIATTCAIKASGAEVSWMPVCGKTFCADLSSASDQIKTGEFSAVVITLVGGNVPLGLEPFLEEASRQRVSVIFDAAHALLSTYRGEHVSHWADYCCFSFQSIKHLTTGDGGALTCKSEWAHERAKKLKWFGMTREVPEGMSRLTHQMSYSVPEWGYKAHMNDISAAIGLANLELAKQAVEISVSNAEYYRENIKRYSPVEVPDTCEPSWWAYPIRVARPWVVPLSSKLEKKGVASSPLWPYCSSHRDFPEYAKPEHGCLFIPNGFWVGEEEREYIVDIIEEGLKW